MKTVLWSLFLLASPILQVSGDVSDTVLRWCVTNRAEETKCQAFEVAVAMLKVDGTYTGNVVPSCVKGVDSYECMRLIQSGDADVMALDTGQGYFAGHQHNMMPFLAETYRSQSLHYYSVAVIRSNDLSLTINNLRGKKVCFPGIGMGAGWVYPMGLMLEANMIPIQECNAVVKSVTNFFGDMCLPGALSSFYNPFGNNPTSICKLCTGVLEERCSTSDPYAGYDGAFNCLKSGQGDVAFLRHDTVEMMLANSTEQLQDYSLLCQDGSRRSLGQYDQCNFGKIISNMVMTSSLKQDAEVTAYKTFLLQAASWFGPNGQYSSRFRMFSSLDWDYFGRRDLMFSDVTEGLIDVGVNNTYYKWVDPEFYRKVSSLNYCPLNWARWCVISKDEKSKCQTMLMAFEAKDLRPRLDCILGSSTDNCMSMIANGDADLMNLDPGDVYTAGRKYGLKPIASEDYGNMNSSFYVVAVARKRDHYMTLFNLKKKRACLPGIGRGDGWIVPVNIFIETEQFLPQHCTIFENLGQLFVRSCIPGAVDKLYNPTQKPISLVEGCASGGAKKGRRNSDDYYYGATGAFRCLVEKGGDIAFVRHLTVRDNTDSRNRAIWARNRRADDYELMCKDGSRTQIDNWRNCHLGKVPANAVVTAQYKSEEEKHIYWQLMNYGQQFFSSDILGDFNMFDSGKWSSKSWSSDLIFTDDAVRLMKVEPARQNYKTYLGRSFINQIENLHKYTCVPIKEVSSATTWSASVVIITLTTILQLLI
ncbi:melanotransferrin-like isoform X1 [Mizuhopecten yessoensis]|uniref:melanotransferrin-like isoform X1 n=1 Tax=Mizuhopecten yessoensis TaxID=6573 RepID=UPI000B4599FC|nr:melanotransferrin-like isoform X1 [Mizuhopecten yessoensis]